MDIITDEELVEDRERRGENPRECCQTSRQTAMMMVVLYTGISASIHQNGRQGTEAKTSEFFWQLTCLSLSNRLLPTLHLLCCICAVRCGQRIHHNLLASCTLNSYVGGLLLLPGSHTTLPYFIHKNNYLSFPLSLKPSISVPISSSQLIILFPSLLRSLKLITSVDQQCQLPTLHQLNPCTLPVPTIDELSLLLCNVSSFACALNSLSSHPPQNTVHSALCSFPCVISFPLLLAHSHHYTMCCFFSYQMKKKQHI